jgi:hypothetical protein
MRHVGPNTHYVLRTMKLFNKQNEQTESIYRTDNTMGEKCTKDKRRSTKHAYKINDRVTRTPLKIEDELMCSGRVSSSCSTSGTRRVNLVTNPVTSMFLFLSYFSSVICFINKELLLTQKLLNLGFLAVKLKSSLPTFHGHDVNRCGISVLLLVPLVDLDKTVNRRTDNAMSVLSTKYTEKIEEQEPN